MIPCFVIYISWSIRFFFILYGVVFRVEFLHVYFPCNSFCILFYLMRLISCVVLFLGENGSEPKPISNSISTATKSVPARFLSSKMMKTRSENLQKQEIADVKKIQNEYKPKPKLRWFNLIKKRLCTQIGVTSIFLVEHQKRPLLVFNFNA